MHQLCKSGLIKEGVVKFKDSLTQPPDNRHTAKMLALTRILRGEARGIAAHSFNCTRQTSIWAHVAQGPAVCQDQSRLFYDVFN